MAVETLFLVVLIVSLVIGNLLLSIIPNRQNQKNDLNQNIVLGEEIIGSSNNVENGSSEEKVILSNFNALNEKINLLMHQMELFNSKTRKFGNFKANTEIEMSALKEIIIELQNKYLTSPAKKRKKQKKLNQEQMHKIIYRSQ